MVDQLQHMCEIVERHCEKDRQATTIDGLTLFRMRTSARPAHIVYRPRICIILRGTKTVSLANAPFDADTSIFLFVSVDVPVSSMVYEAEDGRPHIALTLDLDRVMAAAVLQRLSAIPTPSATLAAVTVAKIEPALLDAMERLLRLLDNPSDIAFMKPVILQEIYYRLALSGLGPTLAQYATGSSHLSQISKAASWIRQHYHKPINIADLADRAGMSVTSFHRHFKAVTLMTPIQYRTEIRLQEARRLMLSSGTQAGSAGSAVGYDSQSQFSREYKRKYGVPPALDINRLTRT